MMRRMGINQAEIDAVQVIIKTRDNKMLVFDNPDVSKVNMMGQETYQVVGTPKVQDIDSSPEINDDDVKTVMEQTGASEEEAKNTITECKGDLAEAILKLKSN
jgi:nascent polypeptide-associated complex subunit alpha